VKQFKQPDRGGDLVSVPKANAAEPVAPFIACSKLSTQTITVDNGEVVYGQGEPSRRVFQVIRGTIATVKELSDGRRQVLAFYLPNDILGVSLGSTFYHSAIATVKTTLLAVDRESLDRAARCDAFIDKELRKVLTQEIQHAEDHLLLLGQKDAYEKVLAFLLEMDRRHRSRKTIPLLMSRRDIANYLALTMETVARVMSHLRELGMISFPQNPQTLVLDKTRLRELVFEHERSRAKKLY
jgi:CRP/FNR family transcriptional regulator, nitrogen fixation regulation protein